MTSTKTLYSLALPSGDEDWFRFDLLSERSDESAVSIACGADGDVLALELTNADGATLRHGVAGQNADDANVVSLSLAGLPAGTYYVRVYGGDAASNPEYVATFEPGAPVLNAVGGLTATPLNDGSVALAWSAVAGAVWYQLEAADAENPTDDDWKIIAQGVSEQTFIDSTIVPETRRAYRVRAYRESVLSEGATVANATAKAVVPSTPEALLLDLRDAAFRTFAWAPSPSATSYVVQRSSNQGATWQDLGTVETNAYFDENFDPNVVYFYRVKAVNALGESDWSATQSSETANLPSIVVDVSHLSPVVSSVATNDGSTATGAIDANVGLGDGDLRAQFGVAPSLGDATLEATNGSWTYATTPANDESTGFVDFFTFQIFDDENNYIDETYVVVSSPDVPESPITSGAILAKPDAFAVVNTATAGSSNGLFLNVLDNDLRPSGATLSVQSATLANPNAGTAECGPDGVVFRPNVGFTGTVALVYVVADANGATSTATSTITVSAPPAAWNVGDLAKGCVSVDGGAFRPSDAPSNLVAGSVAFELSDSEAIDGGTRSSTLSVSTSDYGGVYVYRQTEVWEYAYTEDGLTYSGGYISSYVYTRSALRESVEFTLQTRDFIVGGSNGTSTTQSDTSDYVYIEQTLGGVATGSEFYKSTTSLETRKTTASVATTAGFAVPEIANTFVRSFETKTQHKRWS